MNKFDFRMALLNLKSNPVRSFLSILGIVIGMGTVIVVTSVANGMRVSTIEQFTPHANKLLFLKSLNLDNPISNLTINKIKSIEGVVHVFPILDRGYNVKGSVGQSEASVWGLSPSYFDVHGFKIIEGRSITDREYDQRKPVCYLLQNYDQQLFGFEYPIDQYVRFENVKFRVIGIFEPPPHMTHTGMSPEIFVPMGTLQKLVDMRKFNTLQIWSHEGQIDEVKKRITSIIKNNSQLNKQIELRDPRDFVKDYNRWARSWMLQVIIIAFVSLIVGGIGLMNVMLTTVSERTHEIGLRKACGADSTRIKSQFLIESISLSGVGGGLGVVLGVIISYGLMILSDGIIFISIPSISLIASFIFSFLIGIIFGLYPASKAARLSPIEALRYQ